MDDWLLRAVNSSGGRLALFWTHSVSSDWSDAGDGWRGIPGDLKVSLERMLEGADQRSALAQVILASQLGFFYGADSAWCVDQVLPLLDWDRPERASRTWQGYLYWGRWSSPLLRAGLLTQYLQAARHILALPQELQDRLCEHLAGVALTGDVAPSTWIGEFIANADIGHRVAWINHVTWGIGDAPAAAVEEQWNRWMRQYWIGRQQSIPRPLTVVEAGAMCAWIPYLTDSVEEGVGLVLSQPAGLDGHRSIARALTDERLRRSPQALGRYFAHLLDGTDALQEAVAELPRIVRTLNEAGAADIAAVIIERAVGLGCIGAESWLE